MRTEKWLRDDIDVKNPIIMSFVAEVFEHTTELQKAWLCVRLTRKPDAAVISILKSPEVNARYRRSKQNSPCWYIPRENVDQLHHSLSTATQIGGGQIDELLHSLVRYLSQPSGDEEEAHDEVDAGGPVVVEQEATLEDMRPRKRVRFEERLIIPCQGCLYELGQNDGGYAQPEHTCELRSQ